MTVGRRGAAQGRLVKIVNELVLVTGEAQLELLETVGVIRANLQLGADIPAARPLRSNTSLASPGVKLHGSGFIVDRRSAQRLGLGTVSGLEGRIRSYRNGKDLADRPRDAFVVDLVGLTENEVRDRYPTLYQHVLDRVKPERAISVDRELREKWWLFRRTNRQMRDAVRELPRYIATTVTAKHRLFQFLPGDILPDDGLLVIGSADPLTLGVLTSALHLAWALATGSTLEDRPRYIKTRCFDTFPFPADDTGLTPALAVRIRSLAEQLDAHRKARQAAHASVTLTGLYNVLAKLRSGEPLNAKEKLLHEQGLVSVLRTLHDELDAAVLTAYGWADLIAPLADHTPAAAEARAAAVETLLERLVALNAKRAAEEAAGTVRWLRPDFQQRGASGTQTAIDTGGDDEPEAAAPSPAAAPAKRPWPGGLPEQIKAVAEVLAAQPRPMALADLEARFTARGRWRERLPVILDTLVALGRARQLDGAPPRWQAA